METKSFSIKKSVLRAVSVILCVSALLGVFSSCGRGGNVLSFKSASVILQPDTAPPDAKFRVTDSAASPVKVASSGLIELYYDPVTLAGIVRETSKNKYWYALPTAAVAAGGGGTALSVKILAGESIYNLNSQDNSVAFGAAKLEKNDNGFSVAYNMALNKETAAKSAEQVQKGDIWLSVALNYTLKDGSLFASVDMSKTKCAEGIKILDLNFLDFFGSNAGAAKGDYMLVPDGSGAIVKTDTPVDNFETLNFTVYGGSDAKYSALVPAFGVKSEESAFAAIIGSGAEEAIITAQKAAAEGALYNRVGASFNITPYKNDGEKLYASNSSFDGRLEICYRFLLGNNASYAGMAVACREQLIRNSILSTKSVEEAKYLPLSLSLIGKSSVSKNPNSLVPRKKSLTDYSEALDIVTQLKAKGINNIALRYRGALDGGLNQSDIFGAGLMTTLGGRNDFDRLATYMRSQQLSLYLEADILTAGRQNRLSSKKSAHALDGGRLAVMQENPLFGIYGGESFKKYVISPNYIAEASEKLMRRFEYTDFSGFSLSSVGEMLYGDFSADGLSRSEVSAIISEQVKLLATGRSLMVSGGNFNTVKYANYIADMPLSANAPETAAYESVPFIQMILHGTVDYSGAPVNMSEDYKAQLLRGVEYGACPSFELVYTDSGKGNDSSIVYSDWMTIMSKFYVRANEALSDIRGSRIRKHYAVAEGVYCTEYYSGAMIYVNYSEKDFHVNGVTVPSMDFLRIN